jgi:hypothetical protein
MSILLYPEGFSPENQLPLAPRGYSTLSGLSLGLLINGKRNSDHLLLDIADILGQSYRLKSVVTQTKPTHGRMAPAPMLDELSKCDMVITAMGDCGSCSASCVADALFLERRGLPSAVICAQGFTAAASAMGRREGVPGYHFITLQQPFSSLRREEVRDRADRVVPELLEILGVTEGALAAAPTIR